MLVDEYILKSTDKYHRTAPVSVRTAMTPHGFSRYMWLELRVDRHEQE